MQRSFHIFIRHHFNDWYTASLLTEGAYAVYGSNLAKLRNELQEVLARELSLKALFPIGETFFPDLKQRALRMELKVIQNNRLITVPIRFTLLYRTVDEEQELFEVWIPRLGKHFQLFDEENITPWSEEIIRGTFHMKDVATLLNVQYEKNERVEKLDVVYHGPSRYKKELRKRIVQEKEEEWKEPPTVLDQVGVSLSSEAASGRLRRALFRDELMQQMLSILAGHQNRCILLTGPSGVGKTALVHELAHRIKDERVPERLWGVPIWHVTGGRIIAGMKYLGEWQARAQAVIEQVRSQQGILYVDSLLELLSSGSQKSGLNVAQFLLPSIQRGDLLVIAEATPDALALAEQLNAPFVQAFRRLLVPSFPATLSFRILDQVSRRLGRENQVTFSKESINRALEVLVRFGDANALPGSGIDLVERMARLYPPSTTKRELVGTDAVKAFSLSSGFPAELIDPEQLLHDKKVKQFFYDRVIGQDHAMDLLTNLVMMMKSGLNDPEKPLGSFLFMGPTGVGKTESALTLAEYLFQDRKRLIRLDMSEYAYPGSALRLVGGGDGQGDLTRKIREQPFSVVLLDEIEKADPSIFDILLQVLGEGHLTDSTGQTVQFSHTIVIMTSNLGAARKSPPGFSEDGQRQADSHYLEAAEKFFRPEFINRIDFLVPFHDLEKQAIHSIAKRMLDSSLQREGFQRRGLKVKYEPEIVDFLVKHGFDKKYGARPMKRAVDQHVLLPLSRRLIRQNQENVIFELYQSQERIHIMSPLSLQKLPAPRIKEIMLEHGHLWENFLNQVRKRLLGWEETPFFKMLRGQKHSPLQLQLEETLKKLIALETSSNRNPSQLTALQRQQVWEEAIDFEASYRKLEWDFSMELSEGGSTIELLLSAAQVTPASLRKIEALHEMYQKQCELHQFSLESQQINEKISLKMNGDKAALLFSCELGSHRFYYPDEEENLAFFDVVVSDVSNVLGQSEVIAREYSEHEKKIWDSRTEVESDRVMKQLDTVLDDFWLAYLCLQKKES